MSEHAGSSKQAHYKSWQEAWTDFEKLTHNKQESK
jgi:hypothetical protein